VQDGGIDAVSAPRHIAVTHRNLEALFPKGLLAVHDGANDVNENVKLVQWQKVAEAFSPPLVVETDTPGGADGGTGAPDAGRDAGSGGGGGGNVPPTGPGGSIPNDDGGSGCSCSSASVPGLVLFVLAGALLRSRRRRSA
jgi:3-phytase